MHIMPEIRSLALHFGERIELPARLFMQVGRMQRLFPSVVDGKTEDRLLDEEDACISGS